MFLRRRGWHSNFNVCFISCLLYWVFSLVSDFLSCIGLGRGKREMLGECQSSLLHNLFQIDWSTCKNSSCSFFLQDLHQYLKTKPEACETKRLLSDEMSRPGQFLCMKKHGLGVGGGSTRNNCGIHQVVFGERGSKKVSGLLSGRPADGLMETDGSGLSPQWPQPRPVAGSWSHLEAEASRKAESHSLQRWTVDTALFMLLSNLSQFKQLA